MDYQSVFMSKYHFLVLIFIIALFSGFFIVFKEIHKKDKNKKAVLAVVLIILPLYAIYFCLILLPIVKDRQIIESNDYIQEVGIVHGDIYDGYRNYLRTIRIEIDGRNLEFYLAYADDGIHAGDKVKVTYIPNSTYAVVEKIE